MYDAVLEDNFLYAMEYFPLGSLAAPARPLTRDDVLRAVEHAARAVHALHEAGLAHGDVKPGNVMLHEDGGKLSDLGLARVFNAGAALTGMAPETSVEFLDPSLLLGEPPSRATDIWALGATLHRALSGTGPVRRTARAPAFVGDPAGADLATDGVAVADRGRGRRWWPPASPGRPTGRRRRSRWRPDRRAARRERLTATERLAPGRRLAADRRLATGTAL